MKTILFQGDSITDAYRGRQGFMHLGIGYPTLIAAELGYNMPGKFNVINCGISGNRSVDMLSRWKADCINLKPDYLSFLIGVNDTWHEIDFDNGVPVDRYETYLRIMVEDAEIALPNTKIILMEPYITHGTATDKNWNYFRSDIDKRIDVINKLCTEHGFPCVHLQQEFDCALEKAPAENWTQDGVHPTYAGYELIKKAWLETFYKTI